VRGRGLEPPLLSEPDPKSGASTSSAILAWDDSNTLAAHLLGVTGVHVHGMSTRTDHLTAGREAHL
jgi:putative protein kinase ArgK-like GTPase of G3E family